MIRRFKIVWLWREYKIVACFTSCRRDLISARPFLENYTFLPLKFSFSYKLFLWEKFLKSIIIKPANIWWNGRHVVKPTHWITLLTIIKMMDRLARYVPHLAVLTYRLLVKNGTSLYVRNFGIGWWRYLYLFTTCRTILSSFVLCINLISRYMIHSYRVLEESELTFFLLATRVSWYWHFLV